MALSSYRRIRTEEGAYSKWVAHLAGVHGVYVVRRAPDDDEAPIVLYVGESHSNRLRETIQRHFQRWNGSTAGPTFDAAIVEVAIEVLPDADEAIRRQNALIRRHRPIHNRQIPAPEDEAESIDLAEDIDETGAFDELAGFFATV